MQTVVDGDNGDIRVIRPVQLNNVWASNHSLPNSRKSSNHLQKPQTHQSVLGLSPIEISFCENGQHFVNLNLQSNLNS